MNILYIPHARLQRQLNKNTTQRLLILTCSILARKYFTRTHKSTQFGENVNQSTTLRPALWPSKAECLKVVYGELQHVHNWFMEDHLATCEDGKTQ